jgi:hypothetical protein
MLHRVCQTVSRTSPGALSLKYIVKEVIMKRILLATVAALGLALGSGMAFAQHGGHEGGGGHGGGGHGGWHGGGWHGGSHIGIGIGFPGFYWGPGWWGYPYYGYYGGYPYYSSYPYYATSPYSYYPDEPVYGDPAPSSYIQRDMSSPAPVSEGRYSYYCPDPAGYYPQLQNCPKGWLKVVPDAGPRPTPR